MNFITHNNKAILQALTQQNQKRRKKYMDGRIASDNQWKLTYAGYSTIAYKDVLR